MGKNPAGLLGAPLMTLQLENQLSCMGWGAAGIQAGRSVRAIPKGGLFRTEEAGSGTGRGLRALSEERGMAGREDLTHPGRQDVAREPGS